MYSNFRQSWSAQCSDMNRCGTHSAVLDYPAIDTVDVNHTILRISLLIGLIVLILAVAR